MRPRGRAPAPGSPGRGRGRRRATGCRLRRRSSAGAPREARVDLEQHGPPVPVATELHVGDADESDRPRDGGGGLLELGIAEGATGDGDPESTRARVRGTAATTPPDASAITSTEYSSPGRKSCTISPSSVGRAASASASGTRRTPRLPAPWRGLANTGNSHATSAASGPASTVRGTRPVGAQRRESELVEGRVQRVGGRRGEDRGASSSRRSARAISSTSTVEITRSRPSSATIRAIAGTKSSSRPGEPDGVAPVARGRCRSPIRPCRPRRPSDRAVAAGSGSRRRRRGLRLR